MKTLQSLGRFLCFAFTLFALTSHADARDMRIKSGTGEAVFNDPHNEMNRLDVGSKTSDYSRSNQ